MVQSVFIPSVLQNDLMEDIRELLKDYRLQTPQGETSSINVLAQELPIPESKKQKDIPPEQLENGLAEEITDNDPYPYIIVRVLDGEIKDTADSQSVDILLLIGIYDNGGARQGHKIVLDIIAKIYEHFAKTPVLNKRHTLLWPISWTLQDEESYPYYFGGIEQKWEVAGIRRESKYT